VLTDTNRLRVEQYFDKLDSDGDGYIEFTDYDNKVDELCMAAGVPPNSPKAKKVRAQYYSHFNEIAKIIDVDHDGMISKEEWLEKLDTLPSSLTTENTALVDALFDLFDQDGDGKISLGEFDKVAALYGVSRDEYKLVFKRYDTDNSGDLSREEVQKLNADFIGKLINVPK
jgi:Ca2+-binding EF-hand superfamily protein